MAAVTSGSKAAEAETKRDEGLTAATVAAAAGAADQHRSEKKKKKKDKKEKKEKRDKVSKTAYEFLVLFILQNTSVEGENNKRAMAL